MLREFLGFSGKGRQHLVLGGALHHTLQGALANWEPSRWRLFGRDERVDGGKWPKMPEDDQHGGRGDSRWLRIGPSRGGVVT